MHGVTKIAALLLLRSLASLGRLVYTPPVALRHRIKTKKSRVWPRIASGVSSGKGEAI